jgi:uncharacterized YccA/Bax inhibitor family protein
LQLFVLSKLIVAVAGTATGICVTRVRSAPLPGIILLAISTLVGFSATFETTSLALGIAEVWTFYFFAPLSIVYSVNSWRRSPKHNLAILALSAGILLAVLLLSVWLALFFGVSELPPMFSEYFPSLVAIAD